MAGANFAQLKIYNTGKVAVGNIATTPKFLVDLIGGDINTQSSWGYRIDTCYVLRNNNHHEDIFVGVGAGNATMTGHYITAVGNLSGHANTTGTYNSFLGYASGYNNTTGQYNTAIGHSAMASNTTSIGNTMVGYTAGYLTTGGYNTFIGGVAGYYNTSGYQNTFLGYSASANGNNYQNCTAIGYGAVVNASYKVLIGNGGVQYIGGSSNWSNWSDGRFKNNVQENVKGLEFINKLRPITYQMNTQQLDDFIIQNMPDSIKTLHHTTIDFAPSSAIIHSGFIAQEVDSVANVCGYVSSIVNRPANSTDPYSMAYAELVVPLVKAVQELSKKVDSLQILNKLQQKQIAQIQNDLAACCGKPINSDKMKSDNTSGQGNNENTISVELASINQIILYQNEPNPFDGSTVIRYFIPENMQIEAYMVFYDTYGNEIKKVGIKETGAGKIEANAQNLAIGIYSYSLIVNGKVVDTKKMIKNK